MARCGFSGGRCGRARDHRLVQRHPLRTHRLPVILLAAFLRRGRQPARQDRILEKTNDARGGRVMVSAVHEEAMRVAGQNRRHSAGVGRDDGASARKRFEHRRWHVVDVGGLQVDVRFRVVPPDLVWRYSADECDVPKIELIRELSEQRLLRPTADESQRGVRETPLHRAKRAERATQVVERFEVARGNDSWTERVAHPETETLAIDDVRNHRGVDAVSSEYVTQERGRYDVAIDRPKSPSRDPGSMQMVGCLAAPIVQNHRSAEKARNNYSR